MVQYYKSFTRGAITIYRIVVPLPRATWVENFIVIHSAEMKKKSLKWTQWLTVLIRTREHFLCWFSLIVVRELALSTWWIVVEVSSTCIEWNQYHFDCFSFSGGFVGIFNSLLNASLWYPAPSIVDSTKALSERWHKITHNSSYNICYHCSDRKSFIDSTLLKVLLNL